MSATNLKPVIVLAFANDQDNHLAMIKRERKNIYNALRPFHDKDYIQVEKEENTTIEDFFALFNRYNDRIAIFHYGGHASGNHLQLETPAGAAELAHAGGLAQLMGQQNSLQLIFLNGCATRGQVKLLLDCGARLVIATSVPIEDKMATEFAEQFYAALAVHAGIQGAFRKAKAFINTKYGNEKQVGEFRHLGLQEETALTFDMPWGLYINDSLADVEKALAWKLPETSAFTVIIRGAAAGKKEPVNTVLIAELLDAIAKISPEVNRQFERSGQRPAPDQRLIRQVIIDSYPSPVGEQLRKLFADQEISEGRLKQLVVTYETVIELLCFAMLSQLWDARYRDAHLVIAEENAVVLNSFLSLGADNHLSYDYFQLMIAVMDILQKNNIVPYFEALDRFAIVQKQDFSQARAFMEEMRREILGGRVAAAEITSFCRQAEKHLAAIMRVFAFLVQYKLTSIKNIDVVKPRHHGPEYQHNCVILDRATAGTLDEPKIYAAFTENNSVVFLKTVDAVDDYLNLSPFIIDENALTDNPNSKLFIYGYHETADDNFHFRFVNDFDQDLIVSAENYPQITQLFEEFREAVFA
ncbi:CHAT domain-containing protein [candidate division KSB1 bacterium]|nr:CHAT domain-containing protein [candidate division KSB1 bacterium]